MGKLVINTGMISLDVEDSDGSKRGVFRFNPTDISLAKHVLEMQTEIAERGKEFDERINACETPEDKVKVLFDITEYYRKMIDDIFGEGSSQILFGDAHTLGMITDFIDGITPYFNKASANRMKKYKG